MKKNSTQQTPSVTMTATVEQPRGPRSQTLNFLKQFARVYAPAPIGGIIIN